MSHQSMVSHSCRSSTVGSLCLVSRADIVWGRLPHTRATRVVNVRANANGDKKVVFRSCSCSITTRVANVRAKANGDKKFTAAKKVVFRSCSCSIKTRIANVRTKANGDKKFTAAKKVVFRSSSIIFNQNRHFYENKVCTALFSNPPLKCALCTLVKMSKMLNGPLIRE